MIMDLEHVDHPGNVISIAVFGKRCKIRARTEKSVPEKQPEGKGQKSEPSFR